MRFIQADFVFPVTSAPIEKGILVLHPNGRVETVLNDSPVESSQLEKHDGILCPGFVNAHCHLELSHLRGKFPEKTGLPQFLRNVTLQRKADPEEILEAMQTADRQMVENGIVAVGDISNLPDSISVKSKSKIRYHTFIEIFDLNKSQSTTVFKKAIEVIGQFQESGLIATITPHAPYSVSPTLMKMIGVYLDEENSIATIHHQETASETKMMKAAEGELLEMLKSFDPSYADWAGQVPNSYLLDAIPRNVTLQFVHNTYTHKEEVINALMIRSNFYWCFCFRANLFIEGKVPDVNGIQACTDKITLGTDSLSSNHSLDIFEEMKVCSEQFTSIPLEKMIRWATLNGATFLKMDQEIGSFEKGKFPGVNLIKGIDEKKRLVKSSTLEKLK